MAQSMFSIGWWMRSESSLRSLGFVLSSFSFPVVSVSLSGEPKKGVSVQTTVISVADVRHKAWRVEFGQEFRDLFLVWTDNGHHRELQVL